MWDESKFTPYVPKVSLAKEKFQEVLPLFRDETVSVGDRSPLELSEVSL